MDKRLILAVAGSGKTSYIIKKLDLEHRFLIITYTNNNFRSIKSRIIEKFGFLPENIKIFTYFSFLYSFCFKPFLLNKLNITGINFERCNNRFAKRHQRYIDINKRVYSNRLVKLIEIAGAMDDVVARLTKYFDTIMIDEIQDFAGHDFNILPHIVRSNNNIIFVGDFFQHTFDTSTDGPVNRNLHNDYNTYIARFNRMGLTIDSKILSNSYRCSPTICSYITSNLGIEIQSHREDNTDIQAIDSEDIALQIFQDEDVVKLFYQSSSKYHCYSNNWGNSKGEDHYNDVCIALNPTTFKHFSKNTLVNLNPQTRNKLYVAITRTKNDLFFVAEKIFKKNNL